MPRITGTDERVNARGSGASQVRRAGGLALLRRVAGRLLRAIYSASEMRIYRMDAHAAPAPRADDVQFRLDRIEDLELYVPLASGDQPRDVLLQQARVRLAAGAHVYTIIDGDTLQHFSWMMARGERPGVTFQEHFTLPEGSAFLWDAYTHPAARGRGIQGAGLRRKAADAKAERCRWVYVAVAADNGPSRRNIERAGFVHVQSVHTARWLGRQTIRVVGAGARRDGARGGG